MVVSFSVVREHNDNRDVGAAIAIVNVGAICSGALAQPMVGWLLDRFWEGGQVGEVRIYGQAAYENAFWLFPVSCFIAMLIAFLVRETGAKSHVSAP